MKPTQDEPAIDPDPENPVDPDVGGEGIEDETDFDQTDTETE